MKNTPISSSLPLPMALPTPQRLPPLKSLQVFEAAARHGSVARAADELHVTQGAVSRQVRQLEEGLGLALFERRNRGVHLTAAGAQLQQACAQALQTLAQTVDALRQPVEAAPLVLSCEPTLAMHWLIPRLPQFQAAHPDIRLHLVAAGGSVDFVRDRIDLAIRRNDMAMQPDWQVQPLAPEYMGPVATPALAKRWGGAASAKAGNAAALTALHTASRPGAWPHWLAQCSKRDAARLALPAMWLEHFYLCLQAAQSGVGVAMASVLMADAAVQAGSLQAPHGWVADGSHYVLLQPGNRVEHADARPGVVQAWLKAEMQQTLQAHGLPGFV